MSLVDSLLSAIVRADGDALVMHVGERPYVVVGTQTINISTHGLNLDAMTGMLSQLLPGDGQMQLEEFGAVEHKLPQQGDDRFTVVAARGGDDIWIEIRRRRPPTTVATTAPIAQPSVAAPRIDAVAAVDPPVVQVEPEPDIEPTMMQVVEPEAELETVMMPVVEAEPELETVSIHVVEEVAPGPANDLFEQLETYAQAPPEQPTATVPEVEALPEIAAAISEPEPEIEAAPIAASIAEPPPPITPAVVLPMTRTVRIEVPPRVTTRAASGIDRLLRIAAARGASALFLTSDSRPWIRIEGDLRHLESEPPLSRADVEGAILEIAPEGNESIGKGESTEWLAEFEDAGRVRCTTFSDHRGPGLLLRMIATRAATAEQLGLAAEVQALATEPQGLVLVAGPRTSGKSTLISALADLVNRQRAEFIITLERQIRLVHDNKAALVSQREIRGGADDSVAAARAALRESPDVLIVDDLVSPHMVPLLLTAASEGLLVFVSITAPSTADAVQRFIELAPPEMRKAVQNAMAESFRGAVAQVLLKKTGGGLIAAREVLLATAPVTRVISEGQLGQLPLALDSGRKHGMVSFTDALVEYVRGGTVDLREAFRKAPDRNRLLDSLKRDGVDTSIVERLA